MFGFNGFKSVNFILSLVYSCNVIARIVSKCSRLVTQSQHRITQKEEINLCKLGSFASWYSCSSSSSICFIFRSSHPCKIIHQRWSCWLRDWTEQKLPEAMNIHGPKWKARECVISGFINQTKSFLVEIVLDAGTGNVTSRIFRQSFSRSLSKVLRTDLQIETCHSVIKWIVMKAVTASLKSRGFKISIWLWQF